MTYHISYGVKHLTAATLHEAREKAKRLSREVLYHIAIVANGDVIEQWEPRITASGRVAFRVVRG